MNKLPVTLTIPPVGQKGHALVKYLTSAEWAILPDKLEQLSYVVQEFVNGGTVTLGNESSKAYLRKEVAVIPIEGTLVKRAYGLSALSGVRTTRDIQEDIQSALDNPKISGIVLNVDSPGGTVDGTKELADFIYAARQEKPIVAYADGTMASAAYWIGSAASKIVSGETAKVGSIGVVVAHQDVSKQLEEDGVKVTYIYQGKYKVMGNSTTPLDDDSTAYIQSHVDTYYSMFVAAVAKNRGLTTDVVTSQLANGAVFIGQKALELNLVDRVGSLTDAINLTLELGEEPMATDNATSVDVAQFTQMQEQLATLTEQLTTLSTNNTQLAEQLASAQATIDENKAREAAAARTAAVETAFGDLEVSAELRTAAEELSSETLSLVVAEISSRQTKLDEALAELGEPTPKATSEGKDIHTPTTIDAAVDFIVARDKCDADEASDKAMAEFPQLFNV